MAALYGCFVDPRTRENCRRGPDGRPLPEVIVGEGLRLEPRVLNVGTSSERTLEQVAAFDVTFSPAKSVSVLWATVSDPVVREAIVAAHETAVDAGLAYLEANAGHARAGRGGVRRIATSGFVVARFRHRTARTTDPGRVGDPQLHTHCAILNRVRCEDGKWRALDGAAIFAHAHAAGARYGAVLEAELSRVLGVSWQTPDGRVLMREVDGITGEVRGRFSSRRAQITEFYNELEDQWRQVHGRSPMRQERAEMLDEATLRTRQGKRKGAPDIDLHEQWRNAMTSGELAGVDSAVRREVVADGGRLPVGSPALAAAVFDGLEQQRSWWTRVHLFAEVSRLAATVDAEAIELVVEQLARQSVNLQPDHDSEYSHPDRTRFTSQKILDAEARVTAAVDEPIGWTVTTTPEVCAGLGDDQADAVRAICEQDRRVVTVIGPAGAGKTTMLRSVAAAYEHADREVTVLTLAAVAAQVVTEETGLAAGTIAGWKVGTNTIPRNGLLIVDEASMVPTVTLDQLTRVAAAYGTRVALIGDYAQMSAPEAGGLLHDLARHRATVHLTNVRRFRAEWERDASKQLRQQDPTIGATYLEHGRIHGVRADNAVDQVVAAWATDVGNGLKSLIVVDTAAQAAEISARCQQHRLTTGELGDVVGYGRDGNQLRVGDIIQTRRNDNEQTTSDRRRVLNRDTWTITGTDDDGAVEVTHLVSRRTATLTATYLANDVDLGYATTIAGAQGRTVDVGHVLVTPATAHAGLYVGLTRGRQANHAHVIIDGHLHDEFGHGTLSALDAFNTATTRDSHSTRSATTIAKQWAATEPERTTQRQADRRQQELVDWWKLRALQLSPKQHKVLHRKNHLILEALAGTHRDQRSSLVGRALGIIDWRQPPANAAEQVITRLRQIAAPASNAPGATQPAAGPRVEPYQR
jgi:conjugative relaxase-like TrwC/TraI family protein